MTEIIITLSKLYCLRIWFVWRLIKLDQKIPVFYDGSDLKIEVEFNNIFSFENMKCFFFFDSI